ncbi:Dihydrodipicolinate reductase, N-terminus [Musa troglodytarum]|uniref:Annexin n=1 Tax=Musa troglodytarum TaxID=320322 RepID=A0A9E7KQ42_9LILI|nr:Dihydrodipicolinate reductase, N-terminus [Musa troglodytarum]
MASITVPNPLPSPEQDAQDLRKAFQGWGTDEKAIIGILGHRKAAQRATISETYARLYGESLLQRLHSELSGDFRGAVMLWTADPAERDAKLAHKALKKRDDRHVWVIIEVACASSSDHLMAVRKAYHSLFSSSIEEDVAFEFSETNPLRQLLVQLVSSYRYDGEHVDEEIAKSEAAELHDAIRRSHAEVIRILSTRNKVQLKETFKHYEQNFGIAIDEDINNQGGSQLFSMLKAIVWCLTSPERHFAEVIRSSILGLGTDEASLTRSIVSRAEIDMKKIKEEYKKRYRTTLNDDVIGDTSGYYKSFLLALVGIWVFYKVNAKLFSSNHDVMCCLLGRDLNANRRREDDRHLVESQSQSPHIWQRKAHLLEKMRPPPHTLSKADGKKAQRPSPSAAAKMTTLKHPVYPGSCSKTSRIINAATTFCCSMQPSTKNIKVVINGATKEIGRAAIVAVTKARGMEIAGAVDTNLVGHDAGKLCGMEEPLEIPILNDLTMISGSIAQTKANGVVVDFTHPGSVYDNVKQAAAFGLRSVVYVPDIELETVTALSVFCEKASMGCLVAPTLSIGSVLLQQAALQASFHYNNVEIDLPSPEAVQIANNLTDLGQRYNREDISTDNPARGQVLGEDGVRVHSMVLPGLTSTTTVHFSGPGEVYSVRHDVTNVQCLMPGLILAIRKVVRLKNLIYGLEKFL